MLNFAYRNSTTPKTPAQEDKVSKAKMAEILYATHKAAKEALDGILSEHPDYSVEKDGVSVGNIEMDDEAEKYIGCISGECSAYIVYDAERDIVHVLAWWEEGEDYQIRRNGEVVATVDFWGKARHIMRELAESEADAAEEAEFEEVDYTVAEIDCITPEGETINVREL